MVWLIIPTVVLVSLYLSVGILMTRYRVVKDSKSLALEPEYVDRIATLTKEIDNISHSKDCNSRGRSEYWCSCGATKKHRQISDKVKRLTNNLPVAEPVMSTIFVWPGWFIKSYIASLMPEKTPEPEDWTIEQEKAEHPDDYVDWESPFMAKVKSLKETCERNARTLNDPLYKSLERNLDLLAGAYELSQKDEALISEAKQNVQAPVYSVSGAGMLNQAVDKAVKMTKETCDHCENGHDECVDDVLNLYL